MREYPRLDIVTFGRHLLDSDDLDPMYVALNKTADGDTDLAMRWLAAYWCIYHCGAASYLSQFKGTEFWLRLMVAARNEEPTPFGGRWPRGHERRHWRGQNAIKAVDWMAGNFATPERLVDFFANDGNGGSYQEISERAQRVPSNGPWIAFKIADTLERCLGISVDFTEAEVFLFDTPRDAALMLWRQGQGFPAHVKPKDKQAAIHAVVEWLAQQFPNDLAPPHRDRKLGLQELETILCKWKSHMGGSYQVNNDLIDINAGLLPWIPHSPVAQTFHHFMPKVLPC